MSYFVYVTHIDVSMANTHYSNVVICTDSPTKKKSLNLNIYLHCTLSLSLTFLSLVFTGFFLSLISHLPVLLTFISSLSYFVVFILLF